ncbi:MAG: DNA/RNA non-specific endonuclease, partial [Bacteroidales bacterium]|nr:DNA/RNA non-specific endonuclease [Bacteroidales bacterium]
SNLKLRYTANSSSESRYATITLKSRGGVAEISFRQYGVDENKIIQGNYGSATAKQGWLELPATSATDGLEFFTHTMTVGSRPVRNFSYYYSYEDFDALWVAYPLNSGLIGSTVGRNEDAWGYDPQMPESCQQYVVSTYGTGYTRGHQIPSADRQGTLDRNAATFYATNMTPQDYDFNSGIWVRLEGAVRSLAKSSDTLYVVTGAVLGSKKSRDRLGHSITVPDAYFKAFLFSGTGYGKFSGYSAAGVYMEHDSSLSGALGTYAMSIDDLEAKTGIEFFVNLPNKVGAETTKKLKAQQPKSWLPVSWY